MLLLVTLISCTLVTGGFKIPNWVSVDPAVLRELQKDYKGITFDLVLVGGHKYVLPATYVDIGIIYYNFKPKLGDVILLAFPSTGQNWLSELLWLLMNGVNISTAKSKKLSERVPLLEEGLINGNSTLPVNSLSSPRVMRTQLPFSLVPNIASSANKKIYLARNPKDVIVSTYNFIKITLNFTGAIDRFWRYFGNDLDLYCPYWAHLREGFSHKNDKNVLILFAEEKPIQIVKKATAFLGVRNSIGSLRKLESYMKSIEQIDQMSWKNVFSNTLNRQIDDWIDKNIGNIEFSN